MTSITQAAPGYVGRFAPSPTGPLHFGSLVAALGSALDAAANQGRWLLRIEDVDAPRSIAGAADAILRTLEQFGFCWDGAVWWQGNRGDAYAAALSRLIASGDAYPCGCSRRAVEEASTARALDGGWRYPGTCRGRSVSPSPPVAWRLRADAGEMAFDDAVQGRQVQHLADAVGDFVIRRADGLFAYQLAVVVDDAEQGVTHVVRGADLIDSTTRQIYLQRRLALSTPAYAHLPVAVNTAGEKLSKQTFAAALDGTQVAATLVSALRFLGQSPPAGLAGESAGIVWDWARRHWRIDRVPAQRTRPAP